MFNIIYIYGIYIWYTVVTHSIVTYNMLHIPVISACRNTALSFSLGNRERLIDDKCTSDCKARLELGGDEVR